MGDPAKLSIWNDPAVRGSLSWHPDVAENRRSAKFRIAATIAIEFDPAATSENALWAEFDRLTPDFLALAGNPDRRAVGCRQVQVSAIDQVIANYDPAHAPKAPSAARPR